tara:strand:+ start:2744 stop:2989 length:246 start_codon:yes stop_codon:yes gene_type:complete
MIKFNVKELEAVVKWLEDRHNFIWGEKMVITYGDDFFKATWSEQNKKDKVEQLTHEQLAIRVALQTAKEQFEEASQCETQV